MATTIGGAVSRVRNVIKAVKTDAFITDRFIYSLLLKHGAMYIKQEMEKNGLTAFASFFKTLPCVDLVEIDKVEACCDILSGCTIMRTKDPLPKIMTSVNGPLIRTVSSIDGSTDVALTEPLTYQRLQHTSGFKYNKTKYYWYLNNHMYFPNLGWPQAKILALFEGDISKYQCEDKCTSIQNADAPFPDHLYVLIEQGVLKDLGMSTQVPTDTATSDKQSIQKP
jgi:hypothetical protein